MNMKSGKRDHASSVGGGEYNLVGLIGWRRRLEKGEESFWNECRIKQREKLSRRLSFIKKFYLSTNVVNDGRANLTEALPQVNTRTVAYRIYFSNFHIKL